MRICLFITILTLLLGTIAARGEKPIVINDSEATQYVGKEVEVRGRVASVSPLGTTFINFGGDYPNQKVRRIHCSRHPDSSRSAADHHPRKNHQHYGYNPTSRREARD